MTALTGIKRFVDLRIRAAPDTIERHLIVARLLGGATRVLDVGGVPGQLTWYLPRAEIIAANVREPADVLIPEDYLPFQDRAYPATTSLDTLEHVPPERRTSFVSELLRVTERRCILCCPLGSPEHDALEAEIDEWYRDLT